MIFPRLIAAEYLSKIATQKLSVRIHSLLAGKYRPWLKLWYFLRAWDDQGRGWVEVELEVIAAFLNCGISTIRQWLREGEWAGAFRFYRERRGFLKTHLSSLSKLCLALGIKPPQKRKRDKKGEFRCDPSQGWGAVTTITIFQLDKLRPLATAIHIQWRQEQSRFTAWHSLCKRDRELYPSGIPAIKEFFDEKQCFEKIAQGHLPFVIHISSKRVWASKSFVPCGIAQKTLADEKQYSVRQLTNHLKACGMKALQIVQAKSEYRELEQAMAWDAPDFLSASGQLEAVQITDELYQVTERVGKSTKTHTTTMSDQRFFQYLGQTWTYRCNLYQPIFDLLSMRRARSNFRQIVKKSLQNSRSEGAEELRVCFSNTAGLGSLSFNNLNSEKRLELGLEGAEMRPT